MPNLQEIWNSIEESKKEQKEIRAVYKDMLNSTGEYEKIREEMDSLKGRKKQIENATAAEMAGKMQRLELLKAEMNENKQLLADLSITTLMRGEQVEISGPDNTSYEPLWSVRFKKRN